MDLLTTQDFISLPEDLKKAYAKKVTSIITTYRYHMKMGSLPNPNKKYKKRDDSIFREVQEYLSSK